MFPCRKIRQRSSSQVEQYINWSYRLIVWITSCPPRLGNVNKISRGGPLIKISWVADGESSGNSDPQSYIVAYDDSEERISFFSFTFSFALRWIGIMPNLCRRKNLVWIFFYNSRYEHCEGDSVMTLEMKRQSTSLIIKIYITLRYFWMVW